MATLIDYNSTLGQALTYVSVNVTGTIELTLFVLLFIIMATCIGLGLPLEFSAVLCLPLIIVCAMIPAANFGTIFGIALLYISILFVKRFFLNS